MLSGYAWQYIQHVRTEEVFFFVLFLEGIVAEQFMLADMSGTCEHRASVNGYHKH
jgi:hypothetical protein